MKQKLFSLLSLSCLIMAAQNPVPNSSFENWSNGSPVSWSTNNVTGMVVTVTQSSDSHSGTSGARLEPVNALGVVFPPSLITANDFSVSSNYAGFSFYYKCSLSSKDQLICQGNLKQGSNIIAGSQVLITNVHNTSVYTRTTATYTYISTGANKASFSFGMIPTATNTLQVGSYVVIDDVVMVSSIPTELNELYSESSFQLNGSVPNPAKGLSLIPFSLANQAKVEINLYNLEGKKIMELLNTDLNKGRYKAELDATSLNPGLYICRLNANGVFSYTKILVE